MLAPESYTVDLGWSPQPFSGTIDVDRVLAEFEDGATIVLQALHHNWPPIADFCRRLEAALGEPVQANAYFTPRSAQGLAVHHDTHDVFVLQTAGKKHWRVYEPVVELPLQDQKYSKSEARRAGPARRGRRARSRGHDVPPARLAARCAHDRLGVAAPDHRRQGLHLARCGEGGAGRVRDGRRLPAVGAGGRGDARRPARGAGRAARSRGGRGAQAPALHPVAPAGTRGPALAAARPRGARRSTRRSSGARRRSPSSTSPRSRSRARRSPSRRTWRTRSRSSPPPTESSAPGISRATSTTKAGSSSFAASSARASCVFTSSNAVRPSR